MYTAPGWLQTLMHTFGYVSLTHMTANQITWVKFNGVLFLHCFVQPIRLHKAWKQLFGNRAFIWKNKVCYLTLIVAGRPKQFPSGLSWKTPHFASSATNHIHRTWCDYQVRYPDLDCSQLTRSIRWKCTSHTCLGPRNWPFILALCRGQSWWIVAGRILQHF